MTRCMRATFGKSMLSICLATALIAPAAAQLAITEVMSESVMTNPNFRGPDFFELTNFGTNDLDLHGYAFTDNHILENQHYPFDNLVIHGGESVIFCRSNNWIRSGQDFIAWWGLQNLPENLQVRMYLKPGLDGDLRDEVRIRDAVGADVDLVEFGVASIGRTFAYDAVTGQFGTLSIAARNGAFAAELSSDVGSPGWTSGPVPLAIREQPQTQTLDGCGSATFQVVATGLPKPRFQWFRNGSSIEGATAGTLLIPSVLSNGESEYFVVLSNSLSVVTSAVAVLFVNANLLPPRIIRRPVDSTVFPGQTAIFSVEVRGYPCLNYQWKLNNVEISGGAASRIEIPIPADASPGSNECKVLMWNESGMTNSQAILWISPRPRLQISEIMSWPSDDLFSSHKDWFELTNIGTNEVNLKGYRVNDVPSFYAASIVRDPIIVRPGESVIFVEVISRADFVKWWGKDNVPTALQVIPWGGFALDNDGDEIYLWNPAATEVYDAVAAAAFPASLPGLSMEMTNFCDDYGCTSLYLQDSGVGTNGAFRAVEMDEIGSPGWIANPPPRLLSINRSGSEATLRCRVAENKLYRLDWKEYVMDASWRSHAPIIATNSVIVLKDQDLGQAATRFYRLEELP
jgi:hypothetical protein